MRFLNINSCNSKLFLVKLNLAMSMPEAVIAERLEMSKHSSEIVAIIFVLRLQIALLASFDERVVVLVE